MPTFDFSCQHCGAVIEDVYQPIRETSSTMRCPECSGLARKILAFPSIKKSMPDHFNTSLGKHVNNEREYRDGLKEASERASARAGHEMNFSPVDMRDKAALGVTDEGMDATRRREVKEGKRDVVKHFT